MIKLFLWGFEALQPMAPYYYFMYGSGFQVLANANRGLAGSYKICLGLTLAVESRGELALFGWFSVHRKGKSFLYSEYEAVGIMEVAAVVVVVVEELIVAVQLQ